MNIVAPKLVNGNVEIIQDLVYEICDNDYNDVCLLAITFILTSNSNLEKLETILQTKDFNSLQFTAHKCRSSLSIFKFPLLYNTLTEIEQTCKISINEESITTKLIEAVSLYKAMLVLMNSTYRLEQ